MTADFTTARYRQVVDAALARFTFVPFGTPPADGLALWRHDIDFSPQRALALARIERQMGARTTYFVQLASRYYNVFEPAIAESIAEIAALGHAIGVHFDGEVMDAPAGPAWTDRLSFEAQVLARLAGAPVATFSMHNPSTVDGDPFPLPSHAGLLNASHPSLRQAFTYCSDSNGVWPFRPLDHVIADSAVTRLYALTHAEWWQDQPMPPRQRIQRCIDGRADAARRYYDDLLARHGRPNVGLVPPAGTGGA